MTSLADLLAVAIMFSCTCDDVHSANSTLASRCSFWISVTLGFKVLNLIFYFFIMIKA